jgi:hypothetical protein
MLEFTSISVSTYDSASLAERLTEHSAQGWEVVSILQTGTTVTAFVSRPTGHSPTATTSDAVTTFETSEVAPVEGASYLSEANSENAGGLELGTTETAIATATETATETAAQTGSSAAAAPAGWYADPADRFELRYWDGDKWTEYVSRGGQQFTDPPVA